jgi:hypothetical protein
VLSPKWLGEIREDSFSNSRREEGANWHSRPTSNVEVGKEDRGVQTPERSDPISKTQEIHFVWTFPRQHPGNPGGSGLRAASIRDSNLP